MKDLEKWDSSGAFLLKECYMFAAQYESNNAARDILYARGRKIVVPDRSVLDENHITIPYSTQRAVSNVFHALTKEGTPGKISAEFGLQDEISSMPNCGDKEYLLAILALRNGRGKAEQIEALRHIGAALSYSPNDPRYFTMAKVLQQNNG